MKNESTVQDEILVAVSELGGTLWRNNTGVLLDHNGRPVRYGMSNESAQINSVCKSADLIGVVPITITHDMVGKTVGVFLAVEVKKEKWTYSGKGREAAQNNFLEIVNKRGGIGVFANNSDALASHLKRINENATSGRRNTSTSTQT